MDAGGFSTRRAGLPMFNDALITSNMPPAPNFTGSRLGRGRVGLRMARALWVGGIHAPDA